MDVIWTDSNRMDLGVLSDFSIDFDTVKTMDFAWTETLKKDTHGGGTYWYIPGTEYGGIVDDVEIVKESGTLTYAGRNWRGMLSSKIISPPAGQDYKTVSGNLCGIAQSLIAECGVDGLFSAGKADLTISSCQFERYTDLYSGLVKLAYQCGKVLAFTSVQKKRGTESRLDKVVISFIDRIDYSTDVEYTGHDINFRIKKGYNMVNHLICLGQGELKDRTVVHLYVDGDGDIVEKQYYFGLDEIVEVYENTSAATVEELKQGGVGRLGELMNTDNVEVTVPSIDMKIGDVVGGYEEITGISVRREIVNAVVIINDDGISCSYEVGGDEPGAASVPSEIVDEYTLPIASKTTLGGIKAGNTLKVSSDGTLESEQLTAFKEELRVSGIICT